MPCWVLYLDAVLFILPGWLCRHDFHIRVVRRRVTFSLLAHDWSDGTEKKKKNEGKDTLRVRKARIQTITYQTSSQKYVGLKKIKMFDTPVYSTNTAEYNVWKNGTRAWKTLCWGPNNRNEDVFILRGRSVLSTYMWMYQLHAWCLQNSEEGLRSPEMELQMIVSSMWCLRTEPRSSAMATSILLAEPSLQSPQTCLFIRWKVIQLPSLKNTYRVEAKKKKKTATRKKT